MTTDLFNLDDPADEKQAREMVDVIRQMAKDTLADAGADEPDRASAKELLASDEEKLVQSLLSKDSTADDEVENQGERGREVPDIAGLRPDPLRNLHSPLDKGQSDPTLSAVDFARIVAHEVNPISDLRVFWLDGIGAIISNLPKK